MARDGSIQSDSRQWLDPACAALVEIHLIDTALAIRSTADDSMRPVLRADRTFRLITAVLRIETINAMRAVADLLRLS